MLGNFNLTTQKLTQVPSVLGDTYDEPDLQISTDGEELISLEDYYIALRYDKTDNPLIWKDHTPVSLPRELANFHNILFPSDASIYYKVFLLYTYLSIIAGTSLSEEVYKYDSRITYDLQKLQTYFRVQRNSNIVSSDSNYVLNLLGKLSPSENMSYHLNNFIVRQIANTTDLLIFSTTEGRYYNQLATTAPTAENMSVSLTLGQDDYTSKIIRIGSTGISFFLSGPFNDSEYGFLTKSERFWSFTAEAPPVFNFLKKITTIESLPNIVSDMLEYRQTEITTSYQNIWQTHYNTVYRFVGLLLAYVERVQLLWLHQTSQ